ncbi:hypothetical protein BB558_000029 [Smittium angustum]|uniref:Dynamin N-terminal domain-containing protein n=1 Tax=Smittium angustum TaxID=133377 RepID=A0A2U1JFA9_SMIAN|nr:hypothetical protein BB558_000029 [Smittium angustum]
MNNVENEEYAFSSKLYSLNEISKKTLKLLNSIPSHRNDDFFLVYPFGLITSNLAKKISKDDTEKFLFAEKTIEAIYNSWITCTKNVFLPNYGLNEFKFDTNFNPRIIKLNFKYNGIFSASPIDFLSLNDISSLIFKCIEDARNEITNFFPYLVGNEYKILVLGETKTGKTSLINQIYLDEIMPTDSQKNTSNFIEISDYSNNNLHHEAHIHKQGTRYNKHSSETYDIISYSDIKNGSLDNLNNKIIHVYTNENLKFREDVINRIPLNISIIDSPGIKDENLFDFQQKILNEHIRDFVYMIRVKRISEDEKYFLDLLHRKKIDIFFIFVLNEPENGISLEGENRISLEKFMEELKECMPDINFERNYICINRDVPGIVYKPFIPNYNIRRIISWMHDKKTPSEVEICLEYVQKFLQELKFVFVKSLKCFEDHSEMLQKSIKINQFERECLSEIYQYNVKKADHYFKANIRNIKDHTRHEIKNYINELYYLKISVSSSIKNEKAYASEYLKKLVLCLEKKTGEIQANSVKRFEKAISEFKRFHNISDKFTFESYKQQNDFDIFYSEISNESGRFIQKAIAEIISTDPNSIYSSVLPFGLSKYHILLIESMVAIYLNAIDMSGGYLNILLGCMKCVIYSSAGLLGIVIFNTLTNAIERKIKTTQFKFLKEKLTKMDYVDSVCQKITKKFESYFEKQLEGFSKYFYSEYQNKRINFSKERERKKNYDNNIIMMKNVIENIDEILEEFCFN